MRERVHELLQTLEAEGLLSAESHEAPLLEHLLPVKSLWYLKVMVAIAALCASCLFVLFLAINSGSQGGWYWLNSGLFCFLIAAGMLRLARIRFFNYFSTTMALTGIGLCLIGAAELGDSHGSILFVHGLTLTLLFVFRDRVLQGLWQVGFLMNLTAWLQYQAPGLFLPILVVALFWTCVALLDQEKEGLRTLAYSCGVMAVFACFWVLIPHPWSGRLPLFDLWIAGKFGIALITAHLVFRGQDVAITAGRCLAVLVLAVLVFVLPIALVTCSGIMVFAYLRREQMLLSLACLGFAISLSLYYYNMVETLMVKSFILMGVGAAMLLLRQGLKRNGNQEVVHAN